ncbi:VOC family protein [Amycolatopsis acidiphila]|uniref:VOC family protein n=1 Tax=Amycolatopsis acidiphila TaxID=715473 RepID=A0A558AN64_9PSEU|nr:VOC family protein [Amycolatopsis acidiphila]TVT25704.1 VOC family protein [Amycolatopsis acidiphila]UIJ60463.1 VOC family protein [Amycolatopsis acidiphila]GHG82759.1 glyoxalase [Amycolatopsis acidiphila]
MSEIPTFRCVVLDCPDPRALADFYAALLDWGEPEADPDGHWVDLPGPGGVKISFQCVENYRPPQWPGQDVPQQLHLDLGVTDLVAGRERALSVGAKLLDDRGTTFHVYADPVGHPFCLCAC